MALIARNGRKGCTAKKDSELKRGVGARRLLMQNASAVKPKRVRERTARTAVLIAQSQDVNPHPIITVSMRVPMCKTRYLLRGA